MAAKHCRVKNIGTQYLQSSRQYLRFTTAHLQHIRPCHTYSPLDSTYILVDCPYSSLDSTYSPLDSTYSQLDNTKSPLDGTCSPLDSIYLEQNFQTLCTVQHKKALCTASVPGAKFSWRQLQDAVSHCGRRCRHMWSPLEAADLTVISIGSSWRPWFPFGVADVTVFPVRSSLRNNVPP